MNRVATNKAEIVWNISDNFIERMDNGEFSEKYIMEMKHCEKCPYHTICREQSWFYSCAVWEEMSIREEM